MSRSSSIAISTGLIGSGVLAWAFTARSLEENSALATTLNPFGIKRSPYGEVFAMAMQGPIDADSSMGLFGIAPGQYQQGSKVETQVTQQADKSDSQPVLNPNRILRKTLATMKNGAQTRTNPRPPGEGLKRQLRHQAEDKLRFTYDLDPSHYANYNALHFFLTEPGVGTRPKLTPSVVKLADDTIRYCLEQKHDPRPALTAAAACTNVLHLMFADRLNTKPRFSTVQMRDYLARLDSSLSRYEIIATQWNQENRWSLLSTQRVTECQDRYTFICRIRDAAEETIQRFESEPRTRPSENTANL